MQITTQLLVDFARYCPLLETIRVSDWESREVAEDPRPFEEKDIRSEQEFQSECIWGISRSALSLTSRTDNDHCFQGIFPPITSKHIDGEETWVYSADFLTTIPTLSLEIGI
jgi:hypothetical protein